MAALPPCPLWNAANLARVLLLAASIERAVTHLAEILLGVGAVLALVWGVVQRRIGIFRWPLLVVAALTLGVGTALGAWAWHEKRDRNVLGSPTKEFVPTLRPKKRPPKQIAEEPWPLYGYNVERTRYAPFRMRPPYEGLWSLRARGPLEPPPVVAYGKVFITSARGILYAINSRTGRVVWKRAFPNCIAGSPAVADGILYLPLMHRRPCHKNAPGARGGIVAIGVKGGRTRWRFVTGAVESAPLIVGHRLFFGAWDRHIYALDLRRKRQRTVWSSELDDKVVGAVAYASGRIYAGTNGGRVYALNARTGRQRWRAESFARFGRREYFYAAPAVAYGRVYLGNTDGTVYAYGATTGQLLWARQAGTYVYSAPAVWRNMIFVGTWDGWFSALDARTGDFRWRFTAPGGIMGAPTVIDGLVYFSTFGRSPSGTCGGSRAGRGHVCAQRPQRPADLALPRRPLLAGRRRHAADLHRRQAAALRAHHRAARRQIKRWQALARCDRLRRARARERCRSKARRGTSSGKRGSGTARRTSRSQSRQRRPRQS